MNRTFKISIISLQETDPSLKLFYEKLKSDSLFIMGVKSCLKKNLAIYKTSFYPERTV